MRKFIVSQEITNKILTYSASIVIVVETLLVYTYHWSVPEALGVFGFAVAMFAVPFAIYFIRPASALFKYFFVFFSITYMFSLLYLQDGNIDNIFLLYVILAGASLYFDVKFTLFTTCILCAETTLGFIFLRERLYPLLAPASVISLIFNFLVIGILLAFQGEWGKRMMRSYESAYDKSITDPLTLVRNRAFFDEYLRDAIDKTCMQCEPFSLAILDIDDFKAFNDTYGHLVGDQVLKTTSGLIQKMIRKTDILCRFGGEEFTLILKSTNLTDANVITEKIRASVENNILEHEGKTLHITISMGVTECDIRDDPTVIVERADQALLQAKKNGKNRVVSA